MALQFTSKLIRNTMLFGTSLAVSLVGFAPLAHSLEFPSTGGRGGPSNTTGGGVRGACDGGPQIGHAFAPITTLMPVSQTGIYEHTFVDETVHLFFYISEGFQGKTAELYVEDPETGEVILEDQLLLANGSGLLPVSFPASTGNGTLLTQNKAYAWEFSIICDASDRALDLVTSGQIKRIENTSALPMTPGQDEMTVAGANGYAQALIWQE